VHSLVEWVNVNTKIHGGHKVTCTRVVYAVTTVLQMVNTVQHQVSDTYTVQWHRITKCQSRRGDQPFGGTCSPHLQCTLATSVTSTGPHGVITPKDTTYCQRNLMRWYQPAQWQLISTCPVTTDINLPSDNPDALSTCPVTTRHLPQVWHEIINICNCTCRKFGIQAQAQAQALL
jgi:hypothetical protein